ncbi:metallophosphoesterase [Kribbella sp. NPDC059898]|uniref:metallophosphoesterase n=1 Tax=Kribbella sp. NPDC059898 TaxID=3346995 RepID=UPI003659C7A3
MTARVLDQVIATTDFHSSLDQARSLLSHLHAHRARSLVLDCGDFFEGNPYYLLGAGAVERQLLLSAYDVIAPGNHGWTQYFEPNLWALAVCTNVVDAASGHFLFHQIRTVQMGNRAVGITAVLSQQDFAAIPWAERAEHRVIAPAEALRRLRARHPRIGDWIVLSHAGFADDLQLAADCPFLTVIFAGHGDSDPYGPAQVGTTVIVKGAERGRGYACAEPTLNGWTARVHTTQTAAPAPHGFAPIVDQIAELRTKLIGPRAMPSCLDARIETSNVPNSPRPLPYGRTPGPARRQ